MCMNYNLALILNRIRNNEENEDRRCEKQLHDTKFL